MSDDNIWTDEWDAGEDWSGGGAKSKRLRPRRGARRHGLRARFRQLRRVPLPPRGRGDARRPRRRDDDEDGGRRAARPTRRGRDVPGRPRRSARLIATTATETCRYLMTSTHPSPEVRGVSRARPDHGTGRDRFADRANGIWLLYDVRRDGQRVRAALVSVRRRRRSPGDRPGPRLGAPGAGAAALRRAGTPGLSRGIDGGQRAPLHTSRLRAAGRDRDPRRAARVRPMWREPR